jgi:nucleoid-associated protein YgaU
MRYALKICVVIVLAAGSTGCMSSSPVLANRELTRSESNWRETVTTWYPGWSDTATPLPPRQASAGVVRTAPQPVAVRPPPPARTVRQAPVRRVPAPRPAPVRTASRAQSLPAPIFDINTAGPPASRESFTLVPSSNSATRWYSVKKGDTLASIAKRFYGDGTAWRKIYDANRGAIPDPNRISPSIRLRIP